MGATGSAIRARRGRRRLLAALLFGVVGVVWLAPIRPGVVLGESMSPSFHNGQVFLMSRVGERTRLDLGDVVVLKVDGELYLKRIEATGRQTVWGLDSADVDGVPDIIVSPLDVEEMREFAQARPGVGRVVDLTVPAGHVFVTGDSEPRSYDSRHFGPVPVEAIRGRVVVGRLFRLWGTEGSNQSVVMAGDRRTRAMRGIFAGRPSVSRGARRAGPGKAKQGDLEA
jgi:signal peptidase I